MLRQFSQFHMGCCSGGKGHLICQNSRDRFYGMPALTSEAVRVEANYDENYKWKDVLHEVFGKECLYYLSSLQKEDLR